MTLEYLLQELAQRRIGLYLDGDNLLYRAPANAMKSELKAAIAQHRTAIIVWLQCTAPAAPTKCCDRHGVREFGAWVDESHAYGRIRTICRLCGSFIGYRPHQN